ncbi:MAG: hypothetical protein U0744_05125 [Gemmataceae bacterium]
MLQRLAVFGIFLAFPSLTTAQDDVIRDFSSEHVEKFIRDVLKAEVNKSVNEKSGTIRYSTPTGQYDIFLRTAPKKRDLFFIYDYADLATTREKLNDWNFGFGHTHGATNKDGKATLQASLSLEAGLTWQQLISFYEEIQRERRDFEAFVK